MTRETPLAGAACRSASADRPIFRRDSHYYIRGRELLLLPDRLRRDSHYYFAEGNYLLLLDRPGPLLPDRLAPEEETPTTTSRKGTTTTAALWKLADRPSPPLPAPAMIGRPPSVVGVLKTRDFSSFSRCPTIFIWYYKGLRLLEFLSEELCPFPSPVERLPKVSEIPRAGIKGFCCGWHPGADPGGGSGCSSTPLSFQKLINYCYC